MTTRRLPVLNDSFLDDIQIATPCTVDWNQMSGDERVRHCSDCRLKVYNLAEMTRAEAATLIRANEGQRTCVRLYRRTDGTLLTQDCWARLRAARRNGWMAFAAALVIVCLTQLGIRIAALTWLMNWYNARAVATAPAPQIQMPGVPAIELDGNVQGTVQSERVMMPMGVMAPSPPKTKPRAKAPGVTHLPASNRKK